MVYSMSSQLKTMNFGSKKHYHPIFLYPPVINPEKIKLNLALVEWNMKNAAINDDGYREADDSEDEKTNDDQEYSDEDLAEWNMKNSAINDDGAREADDSKDEKTNDDQEYSDEEEYYGEEDGEKEYRDAVQDLLGLPVD